MEEKSFLQNFKRTPILCYLLLLIPLIVSNLFSQSTDLVNKLREDFQSFRYEKVIYMADSIIISSPFLEKEDLLEIYRLKAVSHYSIGQKPYSELAFKSILQIDSTYTLDPGVNAPKLVHLFNNIKETYKPIRKEKELQSFSLDSSRQRKKGLIAAAGRSIVFPGWGHRYLQQEKGNWFMAGSAVLIPLSVYFTVASWNYEQKYLDEVDAQKIKSRFNDYDKAYQTRNVLLGVYLIYWAYIQYDFYNQTKDNSSNPQVVVNISPFENQLQLSLNISF